MLGSQKVYFFGLDLIYTRPNFYSSMVAVHKYCFYVLIIIRVTNTPNDEFSPAFWLLIYSYNHFSFKYSIQMLSNNGINWLIRAIVYTTLLEIVNTKKMQNKTGLSLSSSHEGLNKLDRATTAPGDLGPSVHLLPWIIRWKRIVTDAS